MSPCHFFCDHVKNTIKMHSNSSVNKNYQTCYRFFCKTDFQPIWHVCTSSRATWISSGDVRHSSHLLALKQLHHWRLMLDEIYLLYQGIQIDPNCGYSKLCANKQLSKVLQRQSWQSQQEEVVRRRPQRCQPSSSAMFIGSLYQLNPTHANLYASNIYSSGSQGFS